MTWLALTGIVCLAWWVQSVTGFGSMLIAVTLGMPLLPPQALVPVLLPLALPQLLYIARKDRAHVRWPLLLRGVLPWMGGGVVVGFALGLLLDAGLLKALFGGLILGLSAREVWRLRGQRPERVVSSAEEALAGTRRPWVVAAGLVHGLFATGGPLLVHALSRAPLDRHALRATLAVVWLVMDCALLGLYSFEGRLDAGSLWMTLSLVPALALGSTLGEWCHQRMPERAFRMTLHALLCVAGALLLGAP